MMKKAVLISLFFIALVQISRAQLSVGAVVGANYSRITIDGDIFDESEFVANYFLGATVSIPLTDKLNFVGDAVYALKGNKVKFGTNATDFRVRINYLDIIPKIEFRPIENIGIAVGFCLGVNAGEATRSGTGAWQNSNGAIKVYNSNFAVTGALRGYFGNLFVEAAYAHGLNNISSATFTDANGQPLAISRSYLHNFSLGIGYLFEL